MTTSHWTLRLRSRGRWSLKVGGDRRCGAGPGPVGSPVPLAAGERRADAAVDDGEPRRAALAHRPPGRRRPPRDLRGDAGGGVVLCAAFAVSAGRPPFQANADDGGPCRDAAGEPAAGRHGAGGVLSHRVDRRAGRDRHGGPGGDHAGLVQHRCRALAGRAPDRRPGLPAECAGGGPVDRAGGGRRHPGSVRHSDGLVGQCSVPHGGVSARVARGGAAARCFSAVGSSVDARSARWPGGQMEDPDGARLDLRVLPCDDLLRAGHRHAGAAEGAVAGLVGRMARRVRSGTVCRHARRVARRLDVGGQARGAVSRQHERRFLDMPHDEAAGFYAREHPALFSAGPTSSSIKP